MADRSAVDLQHTPITHEDSERHVVVRGLDQRQCLLVIRQRLVPAAQGFVDQRPRLQKTPRISLRRERFGEFDLP